MATSKKQALCHPSKLNHARGMCSACYVKWYRATHEESRLSHIKSNKLWKKRHPEKARDLERRYRYGIPKDDYYNLLKLSKGLCGICGISPKKLCVDHDHKTGKVRGMLCDKCNKALGFYEYLIALEPKLSNYLSTSSGWFRTLKAEQGSTTHRIL